MYVSLHTSRQTLKQQEPAAAAFARRIVLQLLRATAPSSVNDASEAVPWIQKHGNSAKVYEKDPKSIRIANVWEETFDRREKRSVLLFTSVVATGGTRTFRADLMGTGGG
jgi:hypothetical protein